jgi:hypothetical protein
MNALQSINVLSFDDKHEVVRPFANELHQLGLQQMWANQSQNNKPDLKFTSFLTLWKYTSNIPFSHIEDIWEYPDKGNGHDWELLGIIDSSSLAAQLATAVKSNQ